MDSKKRPGSEIEASPTKRQKTSEEGEKSYSDEDTALIHKIISKEWDGCMTEVYNAYMVEKGSMPKAMAEMNRQRLMCQCKMPCKLGRSSKKLKEGITPQWRAWDRTKIGIEPTKTFSRPNANYKRWFISCPTYDFTAKKSDCDYFMWLDGDEKRKEPPIALHKIIIDKLPFLAENWHTTPAPPPGYDEKLELARIY